MIKSALAKMASGTASTSLVMILGALIAIPFLLIPLLLVFGLQLLGFGISVSLKSWFGSVLIMIYISLCRIGIKKEFKKNN